MTKSALEVFNDRFPHKRYFSNALHFSVRIAGKERANLAKYIPFNQPHVMFWPSFDVDRLVAAIDWSDRNAPASTLTTPEHAHLLYVLKVSIHIASDGKMKPLKYADAVENALRKKLDADVGCLGLICKNRNHGPWKRAVWQSELYVLDCLAGSLDLNAVNDKVIVPDYGFDRNSILFDKTCKCAYRAIRQRWPEYNQWLQVCYDRAKVYNLQFFLPIDNPEVFSITRNIAKWTNMGFSKAFSIFFVNKFISLKFNLPGVKVVAGRKQRMILVRV